ncbi:MAG TPA: hypothetical protein VE593_12035 [Nitrososphaeraceae archaeon]|nr:hypothetical protein [Nitrososphaeraceae archaeon]
MQNLIIITAIAAVSNSSGSIETAKPHLGNKARKRTLIIIDKAL